MKFHENGRIPRIFHEIRENSQNCDFCATETLETAESTKPYELPLQMDVFEPGTTYSVKFCIFAETTLSRAKRVSRGKTFPGAKPHFPAGGGCGNVNSGLYFVL